MNKKRNRLLILVLGLGVALFVFGGVWITHEFPSFIHGPKTSYEVLQALYRAPARAASFHLESALRFVGQEGIELFIQSSELPRDAEARLLMLVRGERFRDVDVPFLFYLYELYGAPAKNPPGGIEDLA